MSNQALSTNQCTHINAAGRRCRMTVAPTHDTLCAQHLQQHLASQPDPEALAAELLDGTGNLNTADRVNALLANTVKQLARKRIDRQDAMAIGYLSQLLLNSVPGVQKEYQAIRASEAKQAFRKSIAESRVHLRALQPAAADISSRAGLLQQAQRGIVAHAPDRQCAAIEVSSRAERGILAGSPCATDQNVAAPSSDREPSPELSEVAELSDEALLATVLQATSPQRAR